MLSSSNIQVNTEVFVTILGLSFTVCIGVLAWAIKKLVDLGELSARVVEQVENLEARVTANEGDIRVISDRWLPRAYRRPSGPPGVGPGR